MADRTESELSGLGDAMAGQARRVFISYASHDAVVAQKVCSALEGAGFPCWMAPRDVVPGMLYADGIVRAINDSTILVLILSESAVASAHVGKELERASSKRHPIIALRTDTAPLTPAFEYFLSESQWIDAGADGSDVAIASLVGAVRQHLLPAATATPTALPAASAIKHPGATPRRAWVIAAVVIVLALVGAYLVANKGWQYGHSASAVRLGAAPSDTIGDKSIAVLPFTDMSEKKDQEYFADGMAEEVLDQLAKIPGLNVIGRTSSFQFKGKSEDLRAIGARLGATFVVEGSVRKAGPRVRVTAQLIDARSGAHRWSDSYDRDFDDILNLQHEIATGIARALQLAVDTGDSRPLRHLSNPEAYTLFLRGRVALDQLHLPQLIEAVRDFEQALALEPSFLRAAEALATAHVAQGFDEDVASRDAWHKAREAAERALQIDANSASAHGVLGLVHAEDEFDWNAADAEFNKAFALNSRDPVTLRYAGIVAQARGQYQEAQRFFNNSLALDPLDPWTQQALGQTLFASGDFAGAELAIRKSISINAMHDGNHYVLGRMLLLNRQFEAALKEVQAEPADDAKDAGLTMAYYALGRKDESDAALGRLIRASGDTWPYSVATVYAFRMERDDAIKWLEKACEYRDSDNLTGIRDEPEFAPLRDDPRYKALLRRMNLLK